LVINQVVTLSVLVIRETFEPELLGDHIPCWSRAASLSSTTTTAPVLCDDLQIGEFFQRAPYRALAVVQLFLERGKGRECVPGVV